MTLDEIRKSDKLFLTAKDIAPILGSNAQSIRSSSPEELGFKVIKIGTRTKIPRKAFLQWLGEE